MLNFHKSPAAAGPALMLDRLAALGEADSFPLVLAGND